MQAMVGSSRSGTLGNLRQSDGYGSYDYRYPQLVYTLPPGVLEKARSLYYWRTALDFGSTFWSILVLLAVLNFRWAAGLGAWAASVTRKPWLQGFCFAPLILLLLSLLHLPLAILGHHISLSYGQSIQGWGSWFADWGKALLLDLVSGTVVLSVLFALIRRSRPVVALVVDSVAAHAGAGRLRAATGY